MPTEEELPYEIAVEAVLPRLTFIEYILNEFTCLDGSYLRRELKHLLLQ